MSKKFGFNLGAVKSIKCFQQESGMDLQQAYIQIWSPGLRLNKRDNDTAIYQERKLQGYGIVERGGMSLIFLVNI